MKNGPHVSVRVYAVILLVLLGLTALTTAVAFMDLGGGLNGVAAIAIAVFKALLVILYFMHVRYSDRFTWVLVSVGFFWLLILVGGVMDDFLTRNWPTGR